MATAGDQLALSVDDVCVAYGSIHALDHVTLDIPSSVSVSVIGPNGSGKSTLLKVLGGVIPATTGKVERYGQKTAMVLQSTDIDQAVPITVRDTVAMGRYASLGLLRRFGAKDRKAVNDALTRMDLVDVASRQLHQLSGGQRQRAFVAQGIAQESSLLLLDEPMSGLDVSSRSTIKQVLEEERQDGRTTIVSTHDFNEALASDRVLLLASSCIAFGPPTEVLTEANLQTAFGGRFVRVGDTMVLDDPHHHH